MKVELTLKIEFIIDGESCVYEKGRNMIFHRWMQSGDIPVAIVEDIETGQFIEVPIITIKRIKK